MKSLASRVVPRFFAPMQLSLGDEIDLPERVARHCAVLRLRRGDALVVFNGEGGEFSAELTRVSRGDSRARGISKQTPDAYRDLKQLEPPSRVTLLVGPEGGLAPEERQRAEGSGFVPVRFGPRVLRTETAPLATIAAMQALWGDC